MKITRGRPLPQDASPLRDLCGGAVHLPSGPGYAAARRAWNLAVDQRPAAVAYPADPSEVAAVLRGAADAGLRVAPQSTGHNAGTLGPLDDVVLVRTGAMVGVYVDAARRSLRARAGALWVDAVEAAAAHGLAALHCTSPDVGVVGYSLGGGLGWYARAFGQQATSVTAVELVTADGSVVRADAKHDADLLWASRGGGGVGIVTALEFSLYPIDVAYAGMLAWDWRDAARVLARWVDWAPTAPETVTTALRILSAPASAGPLRGRRLVVVDGAVLADPDGTALTPFRELRPEVDTFANVPTSRVVWRPVDPVGPTATVSDSVLLNAFPPDAIEALLDATAPSTDTMEVRQLGGALGRPHPAGGALSQVDGQFLLVVSGDTRPGLDAIAPYTSGRPYLNFVTHRMDAQPAFAPDVWNRLRAVRAAVDPDRRLLTGNGPQLGEP